MKKMMKKRILLSFSSIFLIGLLNNLGVAGKTFAKEDSGARSFSSLIDVRRLARIPKKIREGERLICINNLKILAKIMIEKVVDRINQLGLVKVNGVDNKWFSEQIKSKSGILYTASEQVAAIATDASQWALKDFNSAKEKNFGRYFESVAKELDEVPLAFFGYLREEAKKNLVARKKLLLEKNIKNEIKRIFWQNYVDHDNVTKRFCLNIEINKLNPYYIKVINALKKLNADIDLPDNLTLHALTIYQKKYKRNYIRSD